MATVVAALAVALTHTPSVAHVTLERQEGVADSYFKVVLRVPHGCEGEAMIKLRVAIPDGVLAVKPMPKHGWELATMKGKLAEPIKDSHGALITEGVREVAWSGGKLLDAHYDEFVMQVRLPNTPGVTLVWPVIQECEAGKFARWIEVPAAGQTERDLKMPAAFMRLVPRSQ